MDVTELLVDARRAAGLTQRELAERSGTSAPAICEYESGRRTPRVDTLERIVEATGARLRVDVEGLATPTVDVERNGMLLASLFDFVDRVPRRRRGELTARTLANEAR